MLRFTLRDVLWLVVVVALVAIWVLDRWLLTNTIKNCRFVIEHQRQTINELSGRESSP